MKLPAFLQARRKGKPATAPVMPGGAVFALAGLGAAVDGSGRAIRRSVPSTQRCSCSSRACCSSVS